jgi:glycerophosphoryl diester phosphodiesterase
VTPAPPHPFFEGLSPTLHIAHRGGALIAPENTMAAFEQAVRVHRTDMLEMDVQLTRDGELVVAHDDEVDRCTDGTGDISGFDLGELRRLDAGYRFSPDGGQTFPFRGRGVQIPTLREVLEAFPSLRFNIEVKRPQPGIEEKFAHELRRANALHRACIGSSDDALGDRLQRLLPEAAHFYPLSALTEFVMAVRTGEEPPDDPRFLVLDMPLEYSGMRLVDELLVEAVRRRGRWVNVWTIDDPASMRSLVELGVGGVMTDRPDLLRRVLDEAASR